MKIGIDIDEVIAEYLKNFLEYLSSKKGIYIDYSDIKDYNSLSNVLGIDDEKVGDLIIDHTNNTLALLELELIEGSLEAINFLDDNHEIYFITSRHPSNKIKTIDFFKKHFPNKNFKIIFSGDAWGGNKSKAEICLEIGCDFIIEDNSVYAKECASNGIKVILFDKPLNKLEKPTKNIFRVRGWKEAIDKINKFELRQNVE